MNSLVRVFSNFKDFYNDINGATLTGAIDVIVVEQPDGEFQCSPFHVRFGKLGVLRSREKVVDIEINGVPSDIQMKLGDSGEAFFVEECNEEDVEELPDNLATSPIPKSFFPVKTNADNTLEDVAAVAADNAKIASDDMPILPLPRRNSIDFSKEAPRAAIDLDKFENQVSDYSHRRHTDNVLERRNLSDKLKEYTTQKLRQEWAEHEEIFQFDTIDKDKDWRNNAIIETPVKDATKSEEPAAGAALPADKELGLVVVAKESNNISNNSGNNIQNSNVNSIKDESKLGKTKKRRKKSQMKKKNTQRKTSSSSSMGSNAAIDGNGSGDGISISGNGNGNNNSNSNNIEEAETNSISISNVTNSSSNEEFTAKSSEQQSVALITAPIAGDESPISETGANTPLSSSVSRIPDLDIHFFSDTELHTSPNATNNGSVRGAGGRPSTPIQSDSELEITMREKELDVDDNTALWNWGELPTPEQAKIGANSDSAANAQRQSMLSNMFSFMRKANKIRKENAGVGDIYLSDLDAGRIDPQMAALYFPSPLPKGESPIVDQQEREQHHVGDDDRESGNGTSLPHSPSSMEGQKSLDSDFDDGKHHDSKYVNGMNELKFRYLNFVAMSLCGMPDGSDPTDGEFNRHLVKYPDVCKNPSLFASPNLVVRLSGKYYTWAVACPIVMTIITFQKPLTNETIKQLMAGTNDGRSKDETAMEFSNDEHQKAESDGMATNAAGETSGQTRRSWWNWRRSQGNVTAAPNAKAAKGDEKGDEKDGDQTAVGTQTTRPNSPDMSDNTLSKTESTLNAENTSAMVDNMEDLSIISNKSDESKDRYRKTLRLSSAAIKKLHLKDGMNEIEFSVTTAYQGTTRCKCYLFRWKHTDKVVISDIDGTITKSDVLGHILPMVGKDWAQLGVAQLFSKIEQNGYKLLYLSARAIGQSRVTREYLRSIRQGNVMLPDGPLLLNPTSLISAFHREVIEKKPEQFKIACLTDIRDLFPNRDPFYAGYGNRINDVWAYRAVGIPIMRIFTINTKGELKHELTQTFQSSGYINQSLEVDEHFPLLENNDDYDYKTDIFDDDEEEDELKFSESEHSDDDDAEDNDDEYNDDFADDGIDVSSVDEPTADDELIIENHRSVVFAKNEVLVDSKWLLKSTT